MDLALKDRRVLITGGSQGLGKAIARGFLAEGARVIIVSRDPDRLQKTLVELAALGPVEGKAIDLSQRGAPEAVADAYRNRCPGEQCRRDPNR
jgi:3-oxoacyl-[acyl-carrier protein] reductase